MSLIVPVSLFWRVKAGGFRVCSELAAQVPVGEALCIGAGLEGTSTPQKPTRPLAGKPPVISYCPSRSLAAFIRWANPEGSDPVGIQHGRPPVHGALLSLELREFSLCLWAVSGVSRLPPCSVLAEQEWIWKMGAECALGGYSMWV